MGWNMGDVYDAVARAIPGERPALIHGERTTTWAEFARRSDALARGLLERGAAPGDKVALYMRNHPAYMETTAACFKARLVHVNVNYRYVEEELRYILDNSDARFVVYGAEFRDRAEKLRGAVPKVEHWLEVEAGASPAPFAEAYESLAGGSAAGPLDLERSPDDLLFLYTGGTTGMPKGVMWRQEDLWGALETAILAAAGLKERPRDLPHYEELLQGGRPGMLQMPTCPLMHGTGLFAATGTLAGGGCIVTLPSARFEPEEIWGAVERHRIHSLVIVGDAFARPLLDVLDASPGRFEIGSLKGIVSSGVMWSPEVKEGLLRHHAGMILIDSFGSSEAVGFGTSVTDRKGGSRSARFRIGESCKVFTEDHREVEPGSGDVGFIARSGPIPLGYYKDPEKTARTFPTIGGVRYSIPGDWCHVEADGTLTLLGRGSLCINTAGEKVFPEEVEEVLKSHPAVSDAAVVGVPDAKWGQAVTGLVTLRKDTALDETALREHVRERLAAYKVPKRILALEDLGRAVNGKVDYARLGGLARERLGLARA